MKDRHEGKQNSEVALEDCIVGGKYKFEIGYNKLTATYKGIGKRFLKQIILIRFDDEVKDRQIPYKTKIYRI